MLSPDDVRQLPGGSMIIGATWAAYRQPTEPKRHKFWQLTGLVAKLSDGEMARYVQRAADTGDTQIRIIRRGDVTLGATEADLSEIRDEVREVVEDMVATATHGMPMTVGSGVGARHRMRFDRLYPRLASLIRDN